MSNEIIVDISMGQTRVALLENKEVVELYIESSQNQGFVGNIYIGRVMSVLPGMQAAFVDIGYEKNAFLYVKDIISKGKQSKQDGCISEKIHVGEEIMVQVVKEPIGTKGPRITMNIALPGRYLVLLPNGDHIGVSKRIGNTEEKHRLKRIAEKIRPDDMGFIIRTEGEGKGLSDFERDLNLLVKIWNTIEEKGESAYSPELIHKDFNLLLRTIRDMFTNSIDKLVINKKEQYSEAIEFVEMLSPNLLNRIKYFSKRDEIFEYYQIQSKICKALNKKVWLKCGGHIIIDQTEALTAIDVNTGKYVGETHLEETVLHTNLEAAKEIAKQLRLRDIGGIIIIDFIDMNDEHHRNDVIEALKHYLKKDKTKSTVAGITNLGLVEMTRKKVRGRLSTILKVECPYCTGAGKILSPQIVARLAERELYNTCTQSISTDIELQIHPSVLPFLAGPEMENIKRFESIFDKNIIINTCETIKQDEIILKNVDKGSGVC